jgi:RNA polymerase sigma factor (sigma-70 family)
MHDRGITAFVRRLSEPGRYQRATDRELLGLFLNDRDEAAFEILFRRHERLVRTAVARVLTDPDNTADALQATFLVLLRRAEAIDWRAGLGPWLYGVAHRVAVRLRVRDRRQPTLLGADDAADPSPPADPSWREACELLHVELDRLPDRYRLPLLLCYLEGKTRDEAAAALGLTAGAVKGRVRRGCALLRRRLTRRGVTLSVGLLAVTTSQTAVGAVVTVATHSHSPRVEELVREVTRAMTHTNLKLVLFSLVLLTGVACVFGFGETPPRPAATAAAPVPKRPPPVFLVSAVEGNLLLDADGKEVARFESTTNGALSPDGSSVACFHFDREQQHSTIVIRSRNKQVESVTIPVDANSPRLLGGIGVWSADGRRVLFNDTRIRKPGEKPDTAFWVYDLTTRKVTDLKLPKVGYVTDWSRDGKRLLVSVPVEGEVSGRAAWVNADGTGEPEFLTPEGEIAVGARLSPDGGRLLYQRYTRSWLGQWSKPQLCVLDLATKKRTVADEPGETSGFCWSPDGTRVAYTWQKPAANWADVPERTTFLITSDPDGGNRRTVASCKTTVLESSSSHAVSFYWVRDWR